MLTIFGQMYFLGGILTNAYDRLVNKDAVGGSV